MGNRLLHVRQSSIILRRTNLIYDNPRFNDWPGSEGHLFGPFLLDFFLGLSVIKLRELNFKMLSLDFCKANYLYRMIRSYDLKKY